MGPVETDTLWSHQQCQRLHTRNSIAFTRDMSSFTHHTCPGLHLSQAIIFTPHMSWSVYQVCHLYVRYFIFFTSGISLSLHQLWHCFHIGYVIILTTAMSLSAHQACHCFTSSMPLSSLQPIQCLHIRHITTGMLRSLHYLCEGLHKRNVIVTTPDIWLYSRSHKSWSSSKLVK